MNQPESLDCQLGLASRHSDIETRSHKTEGHLDAGEIWWKEKQPQERMHSQEVKVAGISKEAFYIIPHKGPER